MSSFEDWKFKTLHNPVREAKQAAFKAAEPYENAMMKVGFSAAFLQ